MSAPTLDDLYPPKPDHNGLSRSFALLQMAKDRVTAQHADLLDGIEMLEKVVLDTRKAGPEVVALSDAVGFMNKEKWKEAIPHLDALVKARPGFARALFYLALCHMHLKSYTSAGKIADTAERACTDPELRKEIEGLKEQIQLGPASGLLEQATKHMKEEKWGLAVPLLRQVVAKAPRLFIGQFYLGIGLTRLNKHDEARRVLATAEKCARTDDEKKRVRDTQAGVRIANAVDYMKVERWSDAVPLLQAAIQVTPNSFGPHFYLAICYARMERYDQARQEATTAKRHAESSEERAEAEKFLASLDSAKAAKHLKAAIDALNAGSHSSALYSVDVYLRECGSGGPDYAFALYIKAICLAHLRRLAEALECINRAIFSGQAGGDLMNSLRQLQTQLMLAGYR